MGEAIDRLRALLVGESRLRYDIERELPAVLAEVREEGRRLALKEMAEWCDDRSWPDEVPELKLAANYARALMDNPPAPDRYAALLEAVRGAVQCWRVDFPEPHDDEMDVAIQALAAAYEAVKGGKGDGS